MSLSRHRFSNERWGAALNHLHLLFCKRVYILGFEQAVENSRFSKSLISWKTIWFWKIEIYHLMLHDKANVIIELAPKGPIIVEIIEITV